MVTVKKVKIIKWNEVSSFPSLGITLHMVNMDPYLLIKQELLLAAISQSSIEGK